MGGLDTIFKLSVVVNMIDNLTGTSRTINSAVDQTTNSINQMKEQYSSMAKTGTMIATVGTQITNAVLSPVEATFETKKALGELASVGVENFAVMEDAALQFSNTWAGSTKAEFISAAYDIKSGIASLTDEGVAGYTTVSALTAKGTKATVDEMTSLFATGYGIYKNYYDDLSDLEFAELFSAGIAQSVRQFKTTGSQMAQSISTLGAAATSAQVPLEEQLSVLGMLQQTMSGGEAGTKYRAFLKAAGNAGDELGLTFMDANDQLLSMPEILAQLKGKFGETLDAAEKMNLQKAFGTEEAVALIDLMYTKTSDLEGNIISLHGSMGEGTKIALEMAEAMNTDPGSKYAILQQQTQNLKEAIGEQLLPTMNKFWELVGGGVEKLTNWANEHQTLTKFLMHTAMILGVVITIVGLMIGAYGIVGLSMITVVPILGKLGVALKAGALFMWKMIVAVWNFTAALLANPITWIVIGVIALIAALYLLWKHWDKVVVFLDKTWSTFVNGLISAFDWVKDKLFDLPIGFQILIAAIFPFIGIPLMIMSNWGTIVSFFSGLGSKIKTGFANRIQEIKDILKGVPAWFRESGIKIMQTLGEGILEAAMSPVEAVKGALKKVRKLLPFSDAKEGPLSQLTLNGRKILETIGVGVEQSAPSLANTTGIAFEGMLDEVDAVSMKEDNIKPVSLREVFNEKAESSQTTTVSREKSGSTIIIQKLEVKVEKLKDLIKFLEELDDVDNGNGGGVPA